jgi:hypothetical protein
MNPYKNIDIRKFMDSIPKEEVERQTKLQDENNKAVYKEFTDGLKENKCFLCGGQMDSLDDKKPCFHWFTYPKGIKKKHFENYLTRPISYFQLESYFRWLANYERPIGNINDLREEMSPNSYLEMTIKYKNVEWAFSVGHTDKDGHINSKSGATPHYHIQMKVDNRIFIKFNDFHINFTDGDLFTIAMLEQAGDKVKMGHSFGHGMSILEDEENFDILEKAMTTTDDIENAPFNRQTFIEAAPGQTIPGEIIEKAMEESKLTKKPVGLILQKYLKDAKFTTIIQPGEGVPLMTKRSGKK